MQTHKTRTVQSEGTISAQVLRWERESVVCFRNEEELSMAGGTQEKDRKKEVRREGWREGRKKGQDKAERERKLEACVQEPSVWKRGGGKRS